MSQQIISLFLLPWLIYYLKKRQQSLQSREVDNFLNSLPGVVETGLFIDMAYACYVCKSNETVELLSNNE
jgi:ribose 5-phosphate isomerase